MTIQQAQQDTLSQLKNLYDEREATNITDWVMEHLTGKKRIDRLLEKERVLSATKIARLDVILQELATHKPIQYVLGEAWFAGMKFFVNEDVLIPRPETEELVEWIYAESQQSTRNHLQLLDIGTGSGCIPISLKKKQPTLSIAALDVSKGAIAVAERNAGSLGAAIHYILVNFLNEAFWDQLPVVDIIVSNPPYIKESEQNNMRKNVLGFEPSLALFVPDNDALLFYRKIALFGKTNLTEEGTIFVEINEALGKEVTDLFEANGYTVELRKDMEGKDRMLKATL
ncbi:MAG: peptide chain release factor N(5)-glutamine methyltransferase [Chitinophagaceae bacterium]|nr:peptide chain release factor N(5)-glutamine methyltransferase [Chitinophagaceae bacterium]MDP1812630.1 peptide chain release factor N(5)-glutamine methyltransferase [Sediminibacterium sp.]MDP3127517.1 peptide chain release factor N(5)-glutamine methyltransferase [Sediminibacterium sp.]